MPVTVYKSTDASAPALNGLAGSLVTVLDACLVTGYGAKAAAGWLIPFTGTNKRIYQAATGLLKATFRVQDDAPNPTFAGGREARINGGETATTIDVQANKFPTATQLASFFFRKSATADATARPWVCIADGRTVYFFCMCGDYVGYSSMCFGEYYSLKVDNYNAILIGRTIEQVAGTPVALPNQEFLHAFVGLGANLGGHYVPRSFTEFYPSSAQVGKHGNAAHSITDMVGLCNYPNPVDGGLYLAPITIHEGITNTEVIRGRMRGLWHFCHPAAVAINDGDTWSGTGALAGKTFMAIKPTATGLGVFVVETSNTWETN